jgi:hypothetical protein
VSLSHTLHKHTLFERIRPGILNRWHQPKLRLVFESLHI